LCAGLSGCEYVHTLMQRAQSVPTTHQ
jgi:hypothetical protein